MILYTIYDPNMIFKSLNSNAKQNSTSYTELNINGTMLEVSQTDKDYRVERIISTNPSDFLNPRFQPGSIIKSFWK